MGKLPVLIAAAYVAVTFFSLKRSSEPGAPCVEGSGRCLMPLVTTNDRLSLELWVLDRQEDDVSSEDHNNNTARQRQRPAYRWKVVETCRDGLTFAMSDPRTTFDRTNGNCTLDLPEYSRNRENAKPLKAKFVLRCMSEKNANQQGSTSRPMPVAEVPFELTRISQRSLGGSQSKWNFGGGRNAEDVTSKERRNLLSSLADATKGSAEHSAKQINPSPTTDNDSSTRPKVIQVPHFKYHGQPIILRIVNDEQHYGEHTFRGDGIPMQTYPADRSKYRPMAYVDDTALLHSSAIEMAESREGRPSLNLRIRVSIISPLRDVINVQVKMGMEMAESFLHESELDEIRYLISDDHLYRFALTQVISFLHIWLDYMAFRDEVGFYVGRTDMGGLSVSSILTRFACSLIIFLYLLDGGGTSWLVLFSVGSGVAADFFKVWKVLKPTALQSFPFITFRDPSRLSSTEKETTGYDRIARAYLSLLLYPFIAGSALYALHFYAYASWWSWLISNLANAVYTFGFIALCPQLYINYRLKSVAHMPWKVFMYKLFNTFVDDIFAFLIEMPLKHKIMTLRDDVVFIVFLAQAYMYRVDKTRANEFGFAYEKQDEKESGEDKEEEMGVEVKQQKEISAGKG